MKLPCLESTTYGLSSIINCIAPGKYTYRFLVDGVGLNDPTNSATEDDGSGHMDSVIVIRQK